MEEESQRRGFRKRPIRCPGCGRELQFPDAVCPFCGKDIRIQMFVRTHLWLVMLLAVLIGVVLSNYHEMKRELTVSYYRMAESRDNEQLPDYDIEYYEVPGVVVTYRHSRDSGWHEFYSQVPSEDMWLFRDAATIMESCMGNSRKSYLEKMTEKGYEEEDALRALDALKIDFKEQVKRAVKEVFAYGGYSEPGVREKLSEKGFSEEEISFAISYSDADYKKQARIALQSILEMSAMSPEKAETRLQEKGFTDEEISWAFENTEVDWNLMAYLTGKEFLRIGYAKKTNLQELLLKNGFTAEQAGVAAEKLNAR